MYSSLHTDTGKEGTKERESKTKNEKREKRKKEKRDLKLIFQSIQYSKPDILLLKMFPGDEFFDKAFQKRRSKSTTQEKIYI